MQARWHDSPIPINTAVIAENERRWLVQFCIHLTGTPDAAEDLAQETLLEAWRQAHKLTEPSGRRAWLAAIARNMCLRWRRQYWKTPPSVPDADFEDISGELLSVAGELEHGEVVDLVHQALERLDPDTRYVLVQRYLHHASHRIIADHLGVSEDAISMRLSRGRRQLRQILLRDFTEAVAVYTNGAGTGVLWETTRLWCRTCGDHRLLARLPHTSGTIAFRCPGCNPEVTRPGTEFLLSNCHFAHLLGSLRRPTAILARASLWGYHYFQQAMANGTVPCTHCQRPVRLHVTDHENDNIPASLPFLYIGCDACGTAVSSSFHGWLLQHPEIYDFWEKESRIRMLPDESIEVDGQTARVTSFQSLTSKAVLDAVSVRDAVHLSHGVRVMRATGGSSC